MASLRRTSATVVLLLVTAAGNNSRGGLRVVGAFSTPRIHLQPQRHHAAMPRAVSSAGSSRHPASARLDLALSDGASSTDNDDEAAQRKEEEDKAKTYQVIMNHIANLEDAVEKGAVVGSGSNGNSGGAKKAMMKNGDMTTSSSSAQTSVSETSDSSKGKKRNKNPVQYLTGNSPADGKNRLVFTLAFMTGVADVAMVKKYSNFATMMTGNTMWAASHILNGKFGLATYLFGVIACYMAGLAIFRTTYQSLKEQSLQMFAPMITAAFLAADYMTSINPLRKWPSMFLLSASYGIINAVGTDMAGSLCFVVTGHMTKITNSIVDRFSGLAGNKSIDQPSFIRSVYVCVGFFLGAFAAWAGLLAFPGLKERGLLSIMGTVYGALFLWQDAKNVGGWWKKGKGKNCEIDKYDAHCV